MLPWAGQNGYYESRHSIDDEDYWSCRGLTGRLVSGNPAEMLADVLDRTEKRCGLPFYYGILGASERVTLLLSVLNAVIILICSPHNINFSDLIVEHQFGVEELSPKGTLFRWSFLSIHRSCVIERSDNDKLSVDDVKAMLSSCREIISPSRLQALKKVSLGAIGSTVTYLAALSVQIEFYAVGE